MSAANTLLLPQTGAIATSAPTPFNANECDEVTFCISSATNTVLANTETFLFWIVPSAGSPQLQPVYFTYKNSPIAITATPVQAQLTGATGATIFSITLPGGVIYAITKTATAAAVGLDVLTKPRIGGGGS